ncbi:hypothetical protein BABINDRAFT_40298 [Babjeviella inositovora NRRL Y-12698]|uniref:GTP-binding protein n=1 Tax=Babjeviella inositovora NRRL Y-12698 TaxID=984486 RepID=A0A1E3QKA4_9ASCO|nr:uncharacterized protein BABINDRAFT_40298 [Babjeviella inositovora NRRL Y-12698]ODQ78115.1 hypothetical protein BABINDRAFT_40298 [Babjeviella inositovora NRRL Y-12698]
MSNASRKKLLLMGRSGSGKSSMRSIIFSNYSAFDTRRLGATIDVEHSHLRFLGNMSLNLWDCGGQDVFMDNYFTQQNSHIFKMCEVLIYVFDVESKEVLKDIEIFQKTLANLAKFSKNCKIFILLHKMDLVQLDKREELFTIMMKTLINQSLKYGFQIKGFPTSIWDESLYKAWSSIVCSLIPNMEHFEKNLLKFNDIIEAEEIILFEKTTFLVISHFSSAQEHNLLTGAGASDLDPKRFEKISNIIKTYKQSVSKLRTHFQSLVLHGSFSSIFIDVLTDNMYIMIVLPNKSLESAVRDKDEELLILDNIKRARKWFEKIEGGK